MVRSSRKTLHCGQWLSARKGEQERFIRESGIPYTILHSTQFFEFAAGIVQAGTVGHTIRLSSALFQPIASNDVVNALVDLTSKDPVNGIVEIGGPEKLGMDQFAKIYLDTKKDNREIIRRSKRPLFWNRDL